MRPWWIIRDARGRFAVHPLKLETRKSLRDWGAELMRQELSEAIDALTREPDAVREDGARAA